MQPSGTTATSLQCMPSTAPSVTRHWTHAHTNACRLKDSARLGAVDCTEGDKELCGKYGVKGFPTIKVFGLDKKAPSAYESGRDADSIEAFVKNEASKAEGGGMASSKLVPTVDYVKIHEFLHELKPQLPKVLIFPSGKGIPSWIKMVASSYKRTTEEEVNSYKQGKVTDKKIVKKTQPTIVFGAANVTDDRIAKRFGVEEDSAPSVFICFGTHYTSYDGAFKKEDLKEFLDECKYCLSVLIVCVCVCVCVCV